MRRDWSRGRESEGTIDNGEEGGDRFMFVNSSPSLDDPFSSSSLLSPLSTSTSSPKSIEEEKVKLDSICLRVE